ncbi:hypothetical protein F2Q70_00010775 [Brassica cretica]|uniref:Uncharacterized protein n=1 Tax=Brassica cretica TaxID=69181 RepID=A0A8S9LYY3_BRACR|nr:hypothetical protein F2Q70_00010775 [Brassica cretica]
MVATLVLQRDENGDLRDPGGHLCNATCKKIDGQETAILGPSAATEDKVPLQRSLADLTRPSQFYTNRELLWMGIVSNQGSCCKIHIHRNTLRILSSAKWTEKSISLERQLLYSTIELRKTNAYVSSSSAATFNTDRSWILPTFSHELHRCVRCLAMDEDLTTVRLSPAFSGQSASREEAVEEMKDCRSRKQHWYMPISIRSSKEELLFFSDPTRLERSIRKNNRTSLIDTTSTMSINTTSTTSIDTTSTTSIDICDRATIDSSTRTSIDTNPRADMVATLVL